MLRIFTPDGTVIEGIGEVVEIDIDKDWVLNNHLGEQGFDTHLRLVRLDFDTCNVSLSAFDRSDIMPKYTHCKIEIDGKTLNAEYVTWSRITAFPLFFILSK